MFGYILILPLIIVLCDVCLFKVKWVFPLKFTFSHVCMLIIMYVILPNYWLFSSFRFPAVFVLGLWAMYAECLNKLMFCSVITRQSNPPTCCSSQFNKPCNEFTSIWSMFVYNSRETIAPTILSHLILTLFFHCILHQVGNSNKEGGYF